MLPVVWIGAWVERLVGSLRYVLVVFVAIVAGGVTLLVRQTGGRGSLPHIAGALVGLALLAFFRRNHRLVDQAPAESSREGPHTPGARPSPPSEPDDNEHDEQHAIEDE